jgi:hypothetical protein
MTETLNRRRAARLACMLGVRYRAAAVWHQAAVMDLNETGCRLRLGEVLSGGTPIALRFDAPIRDGATSPSLDVQATVMWCRREGLSLQAGMSFAAPPPGLQEILGALTSL